MKIHRKSYLPLVIFGILFLIIYLIGIKVPESAIREFVKSAGPLGPVVLIFLTWLSYFIAPLSGSPFLFAGFYLFGKTVIIYNFIAAIMASITNFLIAKKWGRPVVEKLAGVESLNKIDRLTQNYGLKSLFFFRVFLGVFHDVISYVFGLTRLRFVPYFVISTIGMIPGTILWYYLSSKVNSALLFILLTLAIAYAFLMIYFGWIKITKKKRNQRV